jgi:hypothetical protein
MTTLRVDREYTFWGSDDIELPDGKTFKNVASYYVKWETFFYRFHGEEEFREVQLRCDPSEMDMKHPRTVEVQDVTEEYEEELGNAN